MTMWTPTATIYLPWHALPEAHQRGTRADQPAATAVVPGTLYFVTDEDVLERAADDGLSWERYSLPPSAVPYVFYYRADTTTTSVSDPGAGRIRWNHATQSAATILIVDQLTARDFDAVLFYETVGPQDQIIIQDQDTSQNFQIWALTGPVVKMVDWFQVPVSFVSSGGAGVMANNQGIAVIIKMGANVSGGSGAPTTASYVTLATDATLTSERVLTAGTGISLTDAGAGSTVTIAATGSAAPTTASYVTLGTDATLTSERVLTAGTGITLTDAGAGSTLTVAATATSAVANTGLCQGRLTTETGVAVSTSDRTAQSTIYFTPYYGNRVALYSGSVWAESALTERSLALSGLTSGKNYDVFLYNNSGTLTLELSAAWASDTARTDALTTQDGVLVKSGATTRRLVGTIRTTGTTTTEDSDAKRFVWNAYNRVQRTMRNATETTDSWTYNTTAFRQSNANAANQLDYVVGLNDAVVTAIASSLATGSTGVTQSTSGIGVDSTTANSALVYGGNCIASSVAVVVSARYHGSPGIGRHFLAWLEMGGNNGTNTWYGDAGNATNWQMGITGTVWN